MHLLALSVLLLDVLVSAAKITEIPKAPLATSYDFVIVGGGAAGLALANRLSESKNTTVLVLEAGSAPDVFPLYDVPAMAAGMLGSQLDWGFVTPAQKSLNDRSITYHRGRSLGGSTAINGLAYGRGSASVFDLWEKMGNPGWGWDCVFPYFKKSSTFNPSKTNGTYETFDPAGYSNGDGPLQLTYTNFVTPASETFIEAIDDLGFAPIVKDLNLGNNIGTKQQPLTMTKAQSRASSYDSYYLPIQNRTNLKVVPYASVQQILTTSNGTDLRAVGVSVSLPALGTNAFVLANKEVIMSAGAFQTPQLLMLSGIGPAETLKKVGIPVKLDVPTIGQRMQDHNYFSLTVRANSSTSIDGLFQFFSNGTQIEAAEESYRVNRTGFFTTPGGTTYGFQKVPVADLEAMGADELLNNRTDQAHIEYLFEPTYYPSQVSPTGLQYGPNETETFISITAGMVAPVSRGNVTLQSRLITDQPVINVNYFSAETDRKMAVYAFRNLRKILAHPSMANWGIGPANGEVVPGPDVQTDDEILQHVLNTAIPIWHASGILSDPNFNSPPNNLISANTKIDPNESPSPKSIIMSTAESNRLRICSGEFWESNQYMINYAVTDTHPLTIPKTSSPSTPSFGILDVFPPEIRHCILGHLDFTTLAVVRRVNSQYKTLIDTFSHYRDMMLHAPSVLRALNATRAITYFTSSQLCGSLRDNRCVSCGDFGPFIFLATAERCCYHCLYTEPRFNVETLTEARKKHALKEKPFKAKYPILHVVSGFHYSGFLLIQNRHKGGMKIVSVAQAKELYQPKNKGERISHRVQETREIATSRRQDPNKDRVCRISVFDEGAVYNAPNDAFRGMAATPFPFFDPQKKEVVEPVYCMGCRWQLYDISDGIVTDARDAKWREGFLALRRDVEKAFTEEGFEGHFKVCELAKGYWERHLKGESNVFRQMR
ncbi:hypothetical protein G7Y89_g8962 [Cudoniella acicularis]|uniref:F-box domain-containing protein n=1 Tax=Cudoniella acicularis TaxID=354080 RepID=A0A8H4W037_9HELO|nr:hypothetical protein G7Y89_g8962 [Cudoniella acicularis]